MNEGAKALSLPQVKSKAWDSKLSKNRPASKGLTDVIALMGYLLRYDPKTRMKPIIALTQPFFDEIRELDEDDLLPNGNPYPGHLLTFSDEIKNSTKEEVMKLLERDKAEEGVTLEQKDVNLDNDPANENRY